jgi:hypothetical protein
VRRKDISGSSFGFACRKDSWDHDTNTRTLLDCDLWDCGPVVFPAYQKTSVSIRCAAGAVERVHIGWYRAGKLHLPLTSQAKALQQELDGSDAEDNDDECSCECTWCRDGNCEDCSVRYDRLYWNELLQRL